MAPTQPPDPSLDARDDTIIAIHDPRGLCGVQKVLQAGHGFSQLFGPAEGDAFGAVWISTAPSILRSISTG